MNQQRLTQISEQCRQLDLQILEAQQAYYETRKTVLEAQDKVKELKAAKAQLIEERKALKG